MNWMDEQGIQRQATPEEEDRYQHERLLCLRGMSTLETEQQGAFAHNRSQDQKPQYNAYSSTGK
jgi:hypothetical protein